MTARRILVTGGGGFLGRHIVQAALERGWQVRALGRAPQPDLLAAGVDMRQVDLADRDALIEACDAVETVFHTAALAGVWGKSAAFHRTNVLGTHHLIEACRIQRVGALVHTSSPSVVFDGRDIAGVDEQFPIARHFACDYSRTKAIAERDVRAADATGHGLRTVALRPHLIWGVGDNHLIPRVIARARARQLRIVGSGQNRVDLVHVRNAAHAHLLAESALRARPDRVGGRAYFITDDAPIQLWTWINRLLTELNLPPIQRRIPRWAAEGAGALLESVHRLARLPGEPRMTRFLAQELATDHWFDISAAKRDLEYRPVQDPEAGFQELVNHWRQALRSGGVS